MRNACGVGARPSSVRATVSTTRTPSSRLTVSATAITGTAPSAPASTARITSVNRAGGANGRAASWTATISASAARAVSAARTDACRVRPPVRMVVGTGSPSTHERASSS